MSRRKRAAARRLLGEAAQGNLPVRITRGSLPVWGNGYFEGYLVGLSNEWALLHVICGNMMSTNGYAAVRVRDISTAVLLRERHDGFMVRALALRDDHAVGQPDVLLLDLPGLLSSANTCFPLLVIHTEQRRPDECYIGRVDRITKKRLVLREIDPAAKWSLTRRYKLKHVTRVEFGGGYEQALWQVSEKDRQTAQDHEGQP